MEPSLEAPDCWPLLPAVPDVAELPLDIREAPDSLEANLPLLTPAVGM